AGEVQRDADAERGQLGEAAGAGEAREGGHGGRVGPRRVVEALLESGEADGLRSAAQAGVPVGARAAERGPPVGGVDAAGAADAEGGAGVRVPVALEVAVEPGPYAPLDAVGLRVAAVVAARDPVDLHRGAVGADGACGGVGVAEREQRV